MGLQVEGVQTLLDRCRALGAWWFRDTLSSGKSNASIASQSP